MKIQVQNKIMAAVTILAFAVGTQVKAEAPTADIAAATSIAAPSIPQRLIVVSLEDRKLALIENGAVTKVYAVAVGKPSTPSPVGSFTIERRVANPTYSHHGQMVAPGPGNPVGTRWMGLSVHGYGIHGTNAPTSIGKAASHGCIRMNRTDLQELFALVRAGDAVEIVGERNEQTARLFGLPDAPPTGATSQALQSAQSSPATMTPTAPAINEATATVQTALLNPSAR